MNFLKTLSQIERKMYKRDSAKHKMLTYINTARVLNQQSSMYLNRRNFAMSTSLMELAQKYLNRSRKIRKVIYGE